MGGGYGVVLIDLQGVCLHCLPFEVCWTVSFTDMRVDLIASLLLYFKMKLTSQNT